MSKKQEAISDICQKLFDEFQRSFPLDPDKLKRRKKLTEAEIKVDLDRNLKKFLDKASAERFQHGLGVIGRAKVAFGLQKMLLKAGYPTPMVKEVLYVMLATAFVGNRR